MVIIPDIHGRAFWKDAVKGRENEEIVFLGDYMDAYDDEGIGYNKAKKNFKEIIAFAKSHPNVTLLIGNHDAHYCCGIDKSTRYDYFHAPEIEKLFKSYREGFKLAVEKEINGKKFILSHAGLSKTWLKGHIYSKDIDFEKINPVEWVNNGLAVRDGHLLAMLDDMSFRRGGYGDMGSIVWADIMDHYVDGKGENLFGDYQIFGHTQIIKDPIVFDRFACIDCRRAFILTDGGKLCELNGTELKKTVKPEN